MLARYRRHFTPALLPRWKRWLANDHSANWATTDAICGLLIGPLVAANPRLAGEVAGWAGHRNMWVRRASIVGLIPIARRGIALDTLYRTARKLHRDDEDLIQKAVGWALREAGKSDMDRLERYLRLTGREFRERRCGTRSSAFRPGSAGNCCSRSTKYGMGAEAHCSSRQRQERPGRARLETDVLQFRGDDLSLSVPFKQMKQVRAADGVLSFGSPEARHARAGNGRGRGGPTRSCIRPRGCEKIGVKPDWRVATLGHRRSRLPGGARRRRGIPVDRPQRQELRRDLLRRDSRLAARSSSRR